MHQIVVGVTKAVSERFGHGGIADRMIYLNGYPFLDSKEDHTFGVPVSQAMSSHVVSLAATGMQLRHVERLLADNAYQGFPIVDDGRVLLGYIGCTELRYAVEKAKADKWPATATCCFSGEVGAGELGFERYIDDTPLTVHPRLPLETVMELFKKMGPRVILIEYRGRLTGLVTVKDCLKYQFKVEAGHAGAGQGGDEQGMERLFGWLKGVAGWGDGIVRKVTGRGGEVRLGTRRTGREVELESRDGAGR
jgi:chloride channel 3/4/5